MAIRCCQPSQDNLIEKKNKKINWERKKQRPDLVNAESEFFRRWVVLAPAEKTPIGNHPITTSQNKNVYRGSFVVWWNVPSEVAGREERGLDLWANGKFQVEELYSCGDAAPWWSVARHPLLRGAPADGPRALSLSLRQHSRRGISQGSWFWIYSTFHDKQQT